MSLNKNFYTLTKEMNSCIISMFTLYLNSNEPTTCVQQPPIPQPYQKEFDAQRKVQKRNRHREIHSADSFT